MKKSMFCLAAVALLTAAFGASQAQAQVTETFYTAGSSAQFNTFGIAASNVIAPAAYPLCGSNHWSAKGGSSLGTDSNKISINLVDPRSGSILPEPANIWVAWDNSTSPTVICYYASVDSVVGLRAFFAHATLSISSNAIGAADNALVPLLSTAGVALPSAVYTAINNSVIQAANTDIRPEDGKFATMRTLTSLGTQVTGRAATGLGYGPGPIGTSIQSARSSTVANPVDFSIVATDTDPVNSSTVIREYVDLPIGAAPVLVIANVSNTGAGHLGNATTPVTNINRFNLAKVLEGSITHVRDLTYSATTTSNSPITYAYPPTSPVDVPLNVFIREPLSGTYNTMEWSVPNSVEIDASKWGPGYVSGQEVGVTPSNTNGCTAKPCTTSNVNGGGSGNPLFQIASNGAYRARAIGTGEMISAVNGVADSIGYAFWGYSSYAGKANIKYLTVDGVDPLFSGPSANPSGAGVIPQCSSSTTCSGIPFTNIINGSYPIWSKYRLVYDPTVSTNIAGAMVLYAQNASEPNGANVITDFLPAFDMQTFHSHYAQVVQDNGVAYSPNNGFKHGVPETGGDMGGAVLTIQSELDFLNDTGGNQQVNLQQ